MLTLKSLLDRAAKTDEHQFPVTEIFFHEKTGQLRYVALHTGSAYDHDDTLVEIARFSAPEETGAWPVALTDEDISAAPTWDSGEHPNVAPLALGSWPSILIGPFGNTTSPLLFYAAIMAEEEEEMADAEPPHHSFDPRVDRLERASRRIGGEVFGEDGSLGVLHEMIVDPSSFTITHFIIGDARAQAPYSRLRFMAEDERHIVLNIDSAGLAALPREVA